MNRPFPEGGSLGFRFRLHWQSLLAPGSDFNAFPAMTGPPERVRMVPEAVTLAPLLRGRFARRLKVPDTGAALAGSRAYYAGRGGGQVKAGPLDLASAQCLTAARQRISIREGGGSSSSPPARLGRSA